MKKNDATLQELVIFEEQGSGDYKIAGIEVYGKGIKIVRVVNVDQPLPPLIDEPEDYIPDDFHGDLVLNFLKHPDLSYYLVELCKKKNIPVIASGQQIPGAICPFTCCGLGKKEGLGAYGQQFGVPEYDVELTQDNKIESITVKRAASCGATFQVVREIIGLDIEEAPTVISRQVQYLCLSDPSDFDPVSGKSALHFAGEVHKSALKKAIDQALKERSK
ncbi:MAG: hypothetical protein GXO58_02430 [Thermodesulfobacteria bacterium]|nr:hypothetical protein [Thermodesulfobacteriota bacterium]